MTINASALFMQSPLKLVVLCTGTEGYDEEISSSVQSAGIPG